MKLGDTIESALSTLGITEDRVSHWLGKPCNCKERKEKLNRLGAWARRVLRGKVDDAEYYLSQITNHEDINR